LPGKLLARPVLVGNAFLTPLESVIAIHAAGAGAARSRLFLFPIATFPLTIARMAKKASAAADGSPPVEPKSRKSPVLSRTPLRASSLLDTRVVYCGDNLEQLGPCWTGQYWGETKEKRAFENRHENTKAYIDYLRPRCVQLARVLKQTGSFYYQCDWHASHYVKTILDQIFGENNLTN
jgi:hypothetical protein